MVRRPERDAPESKAHMSCNFDTPTPLKFRCETESDLAKMDWIFHQLGLRTAGTYIINGFSNAGKTFFSLYLATCIENGLPIFGQALDHKGKALHLDWEMGSQTAEFYHYRMRKGLIASSGKEVEYCDYLDMTQQFKLNDENQAMVESQLNRICQGYTVVVLDSLIACMPGTDINADEVRRYLDLLNRVAAKTGACLLIIHHEGKSSGGDALKRVKGSSSIIAAVQGSIALERLKDDTIKAATGKVRLCKGQEFIFTLEDVGEYSPKMRNLEGIQLKLHETSVNKKSSGEEYDNRVLLLIKENPRVTSGAIANAIGGNSKKLTDKLAQLVEDGCISLSKEKKFNHYTITSEGEALLSYSK
jgi:RecA-family ATPase